jgi:hypothetical protein
VKEDAPDIENQSIDHAEAKADLAAEEDHQDHYGLEP